MSYTGNLGHQIDKIHSEKSQFRPHLPQGRGKRSELLRFEVIQSPHLKLREQCEAFLLFTCIHQLRRRSGEVVNLIGGSRCHGRLVN